MTSPLRPVMAAAQSPVAQEPPPSAGGKGWQREMARAERAAWFPGALADHSGEGQRLASETQARAQEARRQARDGERTARGRQAKAIRPASSGPAAPFTAIESSTPHVAVPNHTAVPARWAITMAAVSVPASDLPGPLPGLSGEFRARSALPAVSVDRRDPTRVPAPPTATPSVRLHVEQAAEGLKLWLGIDGEAALVASRAAAILAQLRRDGALAGHRVASIVCNGATLYALAPTASPFPQQES